MQAISVFGLRLPTIAFALLRLLAIHKTIQEQDPTLVGVMAVVWTQIEKHYSIAASTVPCMNQFMATVSTGFGSLNKVTSDTRSHDRTGSHKLTGPDQVLKEDKPETPTELVRERWSPQRENSQLTADAENTARRQTFR